VRAARGAYLRRASLTITPLEKRHQKACVAHLRLRVADLFFMTCCRGAALAFAPRVMARIW